MNDDTVKKLRSEAQLQGISLNSFVNQILTSFLEWHMHEPKIGMVSFTKETARELFTKMSKEQIIDMAKRVGTKEYQNAAIFITGGKMDLGSFLSWFENRMKNSSIQLSHVFDEKSRIHTYIVKHDICENWSLYFKEILVYIFDNVLDMPIEITIASRSMLAFRFREY